MPEPEVEPEAEPEPEPEVEPEVEPEPVAEPEPERSPIIEHKDIAAAAVVAAVNNKEDSEAEFEPEPESDEETSKPVEGKNRSQLRPNMQKASTVLRLDIQSVAKITMHFWFYHSHS